MSRPRVLSLETIRAALAEVLAGAAAWARCECNGGAQDIRRPRGGPDPARTTGTEDIHAQDDTPEDV
jgi:hypothetical protein